MINQSYFTVDLLLTNIFYNYYQLFYYNIDQDITNSLYAKELDQFEAYDVLIKLNQKISVTPLLRSIYLYNENAGVVLNKILNEDQSAKSIDKFVDKDFLSMMNNPASFEKDTFFTRNVSYVLSEKEVNENLITLIFANTGTNGKIESAMALNIDQAVLQQMVTNGDTNDQYQIFFIKNNGDVMSHSDESMLNQNISEYEYIRRILDSEKKNSQFIDKVNGRDSFVSFRKANRFRWIFIGVGEYSKLISTVKAMQKSILLITIVFIFVGMVVAALFASSIYRPFLTLLNDIQKRKNIGNNKRSLDVYDHLKSAFNELADDVDKYKIDSYQLMNTKKIEMLKKIISEKKVYDANDLKLLKTYGISFNQPFFLVIVFKIDSFDGKPAGHWPNNDKLLKFSILNISRELLRDIYKIEGIDNNDFISTILNTGRKSYFEMDIMSGKLKEIQGKIQQHLNCTVTIGTGRIVQDLGNIRDSFQDAVTASNYRIVYGRNTIIQYDNIKEKIYKFHDYPNEIEKQIVNSLKHLSSNRLKEDLDLFFSCIQEFDIYEIRMSISQLVITLSNVINRMLKKCGKMNEYNFMVMSAHVEKLETLKEIKTYLYQLCVKAIKSIHKDPGDNRKILAVNSAKEYINEHFHDKNLSTEIIAEYVQLSRNYIRFIFKEIVNMSISEYLTQIRLNEAKTLLENSEFTVKKIIQMVGYYDNKYFYVIFKKYFGKTPEEYRQELKS